MATFKGTVQGGRGVASRLGHKEMVTTAASWAGAIRVSLNIVDGETKALVEMIKWNGKGHYRVLYSGPIDADGCSASVRGEVKIWPWGSNLRG